MTYIPIAFFLSGRYGIAVLVLFVFTIVGCDRRTDQVTSMQDVLDEGAPVRESWEVDYYVNETVRGSGESRPRLHIFSVYMATYEQGDSTFTLMRGYSDTLSQRVIVHLFDTEGDTSAVVHANRLIYYDEERRFSASGRVVVTTEAGKRLESEDLFWDEKERKIRTPGFTRITTPMETIQGYQLVAEEDLDTYTLARISGQVLVEEER